MFFALSEQNVFDYWHIWPMRNLVINSEASLDKWQELAIATRYVSLYRPLPHSLLILQCFFLAPSSHFKMALSGMIVAYVSLAAKSKLLIFIQSTRALVPICSILLFIVSKRDVMWALSMTHFPLQLYMVFALKCSYTETSANIHSVLVILPVCV